MELITSFTSIKRGMWNVVSAAENAAANLLAASACTVICCVQKKNTFNAASCSTVIPLLAASS